MAIVTGFIDEQRFLAHLRASMQEQLTVASEKFVREAVAKYETEVRMEIGRMVLTLLSEYSVERMGNILQIQVRNAK